MTLPKDALYFSDMGQYTKSTNPPRRKQKSADNLRQNLQKRKEQARARAQQETEKK